MFGINPQDEFSLYENPVAVNITAINNQVVPIVGADPSRVLLVLSVSTPNGSALVAPTGLAIANQGILLLQALNSLVLSSDEHGILCQCGWDSFGTAVGNHITAITVALRRPPEMYGYQGVFHQRGPAPGMPVASLPPARFSSKPRAQAPRGVLAKLGRMCPRLFGEQ